MANTLHTPQPCAPNTRIEDLFAKLRDIHNRRHHGAALIAALHHEHDVSLNRIAEETGLSRKTVQRWARLAPMIETDAKEEA